MVKHRMAPDRQSAIQPPPAAERPALPSADHGMPAWDPDGRTLWWREQKILTALDTPPKLRWISGEFHFTNLFDVAKFVEIS